MRLSSFMAVVIALVAAPALALELPREERVPGGVAIIMLGKYATAPLTRFGDRRVTVIPCAEEWCAVIGLSLGLEPGEHTVSIQDGANTSDVHFTVQPKDYEVQRLTLKDKRMVEPPADDLKRIARDQEVLMRAFATWTDAPPVLHFALPVAGPLTGRFGVRRYFNNQLRAPHSGIDIGAPNGAAVVAPAPGVVIETGNYFFNGNTVFLDHGQGLISMYNHLRTVTVKPGIRVQKGEKIGEVGRTGRVTGAHLHWTISLNNARVDPMLFLTPDALSALVTQR